MTYNRLSVGWVSSGLALAGIGSVALGVYMLARSEWGASTDPVYSTWFMGGLVTIAVGILGFGLMLLGWHLFAQRQLEVTRTRIVVRRWLLVLFDRAGDEITLDGALTARFFVRGGGGKLALERQGSSETFSIWFWSLADARALAATLSEGGASVRWELPYPLDVGGT